MSEKKTDIYVNNFIQKPIFNRNKRDNANKKQCSYLLNDNELLTLENIHPDKNKKSPNLVCHLQIDAEFNNADNIDMNDVELSISEKKTKTRNPIEKYTVSKEEIDKYLNERQTYKQAVTVQIKGYNPTDTTYIYVPEIQLEKMKNANVNYNINYNGTLELPNMPSKGTFIYDNVINNKLVTWSRPYENRVSNQDFLLIDWLKQQGYDANLKHVKLSMEERKEMPILYFKLYGHFLLVDIPLLFKQNTPYYEDLKKAYLYGNITQTRRLIGKSKYDDSCYFNNWVINLNGVDYRVAFKLIDTVGLMGGESSKLKDYCLNTGTPITKEMISSEEIKDMSSTHIKNPYKVHKYGAGDLVMTEMLMNYAEMMKDVYATFNLKQGYTPPALTMGKTVKNFFESYIVNFCGDNINEFLKMSESKKEEYFYDKTYKASASYLSKLAYPKDNNAYLLSKCFGGMIRNNRPLISRICGALSDKDFTSAYAKSMSQLDYPIGNGVVVSCNNLNLNEVLKIIKNDLVDGMWSAVIKTPDKIPLEYEQVFLPSWDRETVRRYKKIKQDTDEYNITGVVNLDSGYVKTFSKKLINAPFTSHNLDFIESELSSKQIKEFYKCEVLAFEYYPKKQRVNTYQELKEIQENHLSDKTIKKQIIHKGWNIQNPNDCHAWTSFKIGEIVDELVSKRNSYEKSHPLNKLYKDINNTLYGDQVSQYFLTSNMVVGNNITAMLRQQMYYSKTSLYMYGAVTDGSISNDNEVLFPKYRIKNPIIEGRIFEYTGMFFNEIDKLKPITENVKLHNRVHYNDQFYLLDDFTTLLNEEIKNSGFKYFPSSLILKILPTKPIKGECLNKEKISKLYNLSNREIYNKDIGHIKPLIGNSKILLNSDGYTIDNKKYSIEEGIKIIEKAATDHPRKIWKNNQLLNGYYFVLEKSKDGIKKYQLQQGLHNIEIKKPLIGVTFQGQGNYHTTDLNNEQDTKRRGYESIKKKHTAFKFNLEKNKIETDTNYYSKESPATKGMKADLKKYPHFLPFIKSQIIKPKAYQKNKKRWMHSSYLPGEECLKVSFMRPLSLSLFTCLSEKQRDNWIKADNRMAKQYSYGLELYFLNDDEKTFNIEKMISTFNEMINSGIIHPQPTLDKSNNLHRKIPDWVFENHHAIKLMKVFINDIEMDDYFDSDYSDEYDNDEFS
jgi:hypothetical protein